MGINIIKEEIKIIIETLGEQYAVINQQIGKIPQIELDIIMANIRRLYERLCDLNKLNSEYPKTKMEEVSEVIMETKVESAGNEAIEPVIEQKNTVAEEKKIEISFEEKVVTIEETKIEEIPEISRSTVNLEKTKEIIFDVEDISKEEAQVTEITKVKMEPPSAEVKPAKPRKKDGVDLFSLAEKETLADKFKETQKSMNDKIASGKPDKTLADKIGKSTITSLKNAIGINDKFLFINELFKGDIQEYNKTIDKLNSYSKLEECTDYLNEQKVKFNWVEKPETYQKLEDLIIRKFL